MCICFGKLMLRFSIEYTHRYVISSAHTPLKRNIFLQAKIVNVAINKFQGTCNCSCKFKVSKLFAIKADLIVCWMLLYKSIISYNLNVDLYDNTFDKDKDKRHKLWLVNSGLRLI